MVVPVFLSPLYIKFNLFGNFSSLKESWWINT